MPPIEWTMMATALATPPAFCNGSAPEQIASVPVLLSSDFDGDGFDDAIDCWP